jgi:valacyclovir hydrolase
MPTFDHGGMHINYEESGQGAPLLLMPGWGGTIEELVPVRQALAAKYRVIAADLPGSGKSGPQPRTYAAGYYNDDARTMLALLKSLNASPAHLVGFSDGGEYALLMGALEPSAAKSIVTWGSAGQLPPAREMAEAMSHMIDAPIPPMEGFSDYMKATYGSANALVMTKSLGQALAEMMDAGGDISLSRASKITSPALIINGENDFLAPPALGQQMAAAMPHAEFVEAKGAGHMVHADSGDWLIGTIMEWLAKR